MRRAVAAAGRLAQLRSAARLRGPARGPRTARTARREARVGGEAQGAGAEPLPRRKSSRGQSRGQGLRSGECWTGICAMGRGRVPVPPPGGGNARRGPLPGPPGVPTAACGLLSSDHHRPPGATPSLLSERSHHSYLLPLLSTPPLLSVPREMAGRGETPGLRPAPRSRREAAGTRAKAAQPGPAAGARTPGAASRRTREAETRRPGGAGKIPPLQPGVALPFARGSRGGELDPVQNRGKAPHTCAWRTNPQPGLECRALV